MGLICLKRYEEAEQLLTGGYSLLAQKYPASDLKVKEALRNLVFLYEKWGKLDQAGEYRAKLPVEPKTER